jgi:hypothetical protein
MISASWLVPTFLAGVIFWQIFSYLLNRRRKS